MLLASAPAAASDSLGGPVAAQVERVIDGDTIEVRAQIWLGQDVVVRVRLTGIDTPEISRPDCTDERAKGLEAKAHLTALIQGQRVQLYDIHYGKYAGRVVARVETHQGFDVSDSLLASGLAVRYSNTRPNWCAEKLTQDLATAHETAGP